MSNLRWVQALVGGGAIAVGMMGCETIASFDRGLIDGGLEAGALPDASLPGTLDGGSDATLPDGTVPEASDDAGAGNDGSLSDAADGGDAAKADAADAAGDASKADASDGASSDAGSDAASGDAASGDAAPGDAAPGDAASDAAGDAGSSSDAGADAVALDSGDDGAPFDGGSCTTLPNTATVILQLDVATDRPVAVGGTIVDGLYFKNRDTIYTGPGGATGATGNVLKETLSVANAASGLATLNSIQTRPGEADITERLTFQPISGGTGTLTFLCPSNGPITTQYSVRVGVTTELDIYIDPDRIETFQLQ